jgi:DNA adenine methylase
MKPPMPYFGGKQTLAPWIVSLLPDHDHYVEPYGGSLAVLLAKPRSRMETVNDLSRELMTFWRILRDRSGELHRVCALTPHSRAEHDTAFDPADDELETARRVWVRLTQGRSNALQRRTGWRNFIDPSGSRTPMPGYLDGYRGRIEPAAERLMGVSLECMPALDLIGKYGAHDRVLLYVDPPYLASTRNSTHYKAELKTDDEHGQLAAALAGCTATVVLSGYDSPLYAGLYDGWHRYEQATTTGNGKGDKARTEVLWANQPLGDQFDLFSEQPA